MNPEYYTVPPFIGIKPTREKPVEIEDLVIGRKGLGEIFFPGKTVLEDIDLSKAVQINRGNVVVYPEDEGKPPVGSELNRTAVVTLHQIWKKTERPTEDFENYLRSVTERMDATFLRYIEDSGSWTFRVSHFSKYGLNDSDEEAELDANALNNRNVAQIPSQKPDALKGPLKTQGLHSDLLGRPVPLDGEETVPKGLFYDAIGTEDVDSFNRFIDPPLQLDELNYLSKTTMSPSQSFMKFNSNNERLYGLKATLFDDDEEMEEEEKEPEPELILVPQEVKRRKEVPSSFTPLISFVDKSVDLPLIQPAMVDSPMYQTPRRHGYLRQLKEVTPYDKSLLFRKHHLLLDAGCFRSLSFRVGWSPQMFFLHKAPSSPVGEETKLGLKPYSASVKSLPPLSSFQTVHCSSIDASSLLSSVFCTKENILENMQKQLKHRNFSVEQDVPFFSARPGVDLLNSHYKVSQRQASQGKCLQNTFTVWSLCSALWGQCQEEEYPSSYNYHLYRKELFSDWLVSTTYADMRKEVESSRKHLEAIFSLLSGNCIAEASCKALEFNDFRLGLLLSQADSFLSFRSGLLRQLENWCQFEVDKFIDARRIKIFSLLAGRVVWKMGDGTLINCCENMDWKRALALHLWYHCLPTASIHEALVAYEESFKGTGSHGKYTECPYPSYIESDKELHMLASQSESSPLDICYYLLKLYCDRSTPLGKLLAPLTYGHSQLDYSLSWMVHQVLLSLGYQHLPDVQAHQLHVSFASQLEAGGLWEWAIFVLLHINEAARRKALVVDVLMRHITLLPNEEELEVESFLTERLHIPSCWIFAAKAVLARSLGNYKEEAVCLLKSKQWNMGHKIIIEKIAADAIIHERLEYLRSFLDELSSPEISCTIQGWSTGGEVYLDYIHVSEKIEQMMSGQVRAYEIEELHPRLISLSNRILNLNCPSAKDRLCQSEMSKKTVTLLRALLTVRRDIMSGTEAVSGNHLLASFFPKLPMPEDYALQEMRATVRSYMLEVTNAERHLP